MEQEWGRGEGGGGIKKKSLHWIKKWQSCTKRHAVSKTNKQNYIITAGEGLQSACNRWLTWSLYFDLYWLWTLEMSSYKVYKRMNQKQTINRGTKVGNRETKNRNTQNKTKENRNTIALKPSWQSGANRHVVFKSNKQNDIIATICA